MLALRIRLDMSHEGFPSMSFSFGYCWHFPLCGAWSQVWLSFLATGDPTENQTDARPSRPSRNTQSNKQLGHYPYPGRFSFSPSIGYSVSTQLWFQQEAS